METLPKTNSCFAVIMEENQNPPRFYLIHNNPDPLGPNGEEGKPEGWGIPGGGNKDKYETPEETIRREVLGEAGLLTEIATRGNTEFGEILFENKPDINNDIFIFHLKKVDDKEGFRVIEETGETRRVMLADLGSILTMPLAMKITHRYQEGGALESVRVSKNPEGIYFSTRERIFGVLEYLGYDFYDLIPDLDKLFPEIKKEEIGRYVYGLLEEVVREKNKTRERRMRFLRPDDDELLELYADLTGENDYFNEILKRYQPWVETGGIECQK